MRIAHLCLSNFYIDGFAYQENELIRQHVATGHEVLVLASTESIKDGKTVYVEPGTYEGAEGATVVRLPYRRGSAKLMRKLRTHPGVYDALQRFCPDTILFHGTCGWEVQTAARYVRDHPDVAFYIDSHEDWNNSAKGFVSRELLHRRYYGPILRMAEGAAEKILCVTTETIDFVHDLYHVPKHRLEFYPLGGHLVEDADYPARRESARTRLGVGPDDIMLVQSGKQTRAKKLTESLRALGRTQDAHLKLFIAGVLAADVEQEVRAMIAADPRVSFLGWQSTKQLRDLLCGADVYLQPGTQSVTMQQSLCCRCAVILADVPAHQVYKRENGWFVRSEVELANALSEVARADIPAMQKNSECLAREMLDYRVLANRIIQ